MSSVRKPSWDFNYCFHIDDFRHGDSLIVLASKRVRVRGRVETVDGKQKLITYRTAKDELYSAELNDIVFLDKHRKDWLDKSST